MSHVPLRDLPEFTGNVLAVLAMLPPKQTATIIALRGDLGAGKTTFVQMFAKKLGITEVVSSPTYVLMKSYPFAGDRTSFGRSRRYSRLVHIDAYRLERPEEFNALQPKELFDDPKALVLVEWPERLGKLLPRPDIRLDFSSEGCAEGERQIKLHVTEG